MCARTMNYVLSVRREIVFFFFTPFRAEKLDSKTIKRSFFFYWRIRAAPLCMYVCIYFYYTKSLCQHSPLGIDVRVTPTL